MEKDKEIEHHKKINRTEKSLDTLEHMTGGTERITLKIGRTETPPEVIEIQKRGRRIASKANLVRNRNIHGHQQ